MSLRKEFNKRALITLLLATTALTMAGCSDQIGSAFNEKADIKGSEPVTETLTNSKQSVKTIYLGASQLKAGGSYKFEENGARLVIDGDIPEDTSITVDGGQLVINGNLSKDVDLVVRVPEFTHSESYPCVLYNAALKMTLPSTCYKVVHDGPKAPYNSDDAVVVKGHVDESAEVSSTPGTTHSYSGKQFKIKL